VRLFTELASTPFDKWLYGAMAFGFEGTKIVLWEIGTKRQKLIALLMVAMSLVASTGAALSVAARSKEGGLDAGKMEGFSAQLDSLDQSIAQCDVNIAAFTTQEAGLPATYVTAAERLQRQIEALYERSSGLQEQRMGLINERMDYSASVNSSASTTMFRLMSGLVGTSEERFVLYFMLCVAVLLEVGALGTTEREGSGGGGATGSNSSVLPCTCGSKRTVVERTADGSRWSVGCKSCNKSSGLALTEAEARDAWNDRAAPKERKSLWKRLTKQHP